MCKYHFLALQKIAQTSSRFSKGNKKKTLSRNADIAIKQSAKTWKSQTKKISGWKWDTDLSQKCQTVKMLKRSLKPWATGH